MGIISWIRSHLSAGVPFDQPSLVRYRYEDPDFEEVERAAADDVAAVEQDGKYFRRDSPGNDPDEL
jgi:hypothetical protein